MPHFRLPLVTLLLSTLAAAQAKPVDAALVARTVQRLADEKAAEADAAMIALIRGGTGSVPLLQAVLQKVETGPAHERAARALSICKVDAPEVAGLKVGLAADKAALAPGETVELTATLCNVSDAPIALFLGMSYSGNVLTNGLALRRLAAGANDQDVQASLGQVGFCGTGAEAIVVLLEPWTSQRFATKATLRTTPEPDGFIRHDGPHLAMGFVYLPVPAEGGALRLQWRHAIAPKSAEGWVGRGAKPDWAGTFTSNELRLELRLPRR